MPYLGLPPTQDAQAIFDFVVAHLRRQNDQCVNDACMCLYRGPNSLMCAAGCLLADTEYDKDMEDKPAMDLQILKQKYGEENVDLIDRLQGIHDQELVQYWEEGFREIADDLKLVFTPRSE